MQCSKIKCEGTTCKSGATRLEIGRAVSIEYMT